MEQGRDEFVSNAIRQRTSAFKTFVGETKWAGVQFQVEDAARRSAEDRFKLLSDHVLQVRRAESAGDRDRGGIIWEESANRLTSILDVEANAYYGLLHRVSPGQDAGGLLQHDPAPFRPGGPVISWRQ